MNLRPQRTFARLTLLLVLCATCGGEKIAGPDTNVVAVHLNIPSASMRLGTTAQLTVTATNAANQTVPSAIVFSSSNPSVLEVGQTGVAHALKMGTAVVVGRAGNVETSATIAVIAGFPAEVTRVSGNNLSATIQSALGTPPSVLVKDSVGNVVEGAVVTFAVVTGGGSIAGASTVSNAGGVATAGSWTLGATPGVNTLSATVSGPSAPVSTTFTANGVALTATSLVLATVPTTAVTGLPLSPVVTVEIRNSAGTLVTTATNTVTMSVAASGGLLGTTTVNAVRGVATFSDVAFAVTGTQSVTLSSDGLTPALSTIIVTHGSELQGDDAVFALIRGFGEPEGKLVQIRNGSSLATPVVADLAIASTTYDQSEPAWLSVRLLKTSTPATLLVEPRVSGLLPGVHQARVKVVAPNAVPVIVNVKLNITALPATRMELTVQPEGLKRGDVLPTQPVIELRDSLDFLAPQGNLVTVRIRNGPAGAKLGGTTTVAAINGIARFTNLSLSASGTYFLQFEVPEGLPVIQSRPVVIKSGVAISLFERPYVAAAGVPLGALSFRVVDANGVQVSNEPTTITVSCRAGPSTAGTLSGTLSRTTVDGVASFTDLILSSSGYYSCDFVTPDIGGIQIGFSVT